LIGEAGDHLRQIVADKKHWLCRWRGRARLSVTSGAGRGMKPRSSIMVGFIEPQDLDAAQAERTPVD
jgi:hypothetical protein